MTLSNLVAVLGAARLRKRDRKRLRLARFRDNFSGDFRPFRVR